MQWFYSSERVGSFSKEKLFGLQLDSRLVDNEIMPSSRQFSFHFDGDENVTALDVVTAYGELLDARLQSLRDLKHAA